MPRVLFENVKGCDGPHEFGGRPVLKRDYGSEQDCARKNGWQIYEFKRGFFAFCPRCVPDALRHIACETLADPKFDASVWSVNEPLDSKHWYKRKET